MTCAARRPVSTWRPVTYARERHARPSSDRLTEAVWAMSVPNGGSVPPLIFAQFAAARRLRASDHASMTERRSDTRFSSPVGPRAAQIAASTVSRVGSRPGWSWSAAERSDRRWWLCMFAIYLAGLGDRYELDAHDVACNADYTTFYARQPAFTGKPRLEVATPTAAHSRVVLPPIPRALLSQGAVPARR